MTDERIEQDAIELAEDFTDWMGPSWPMMGAFTATKKLATMSNKRLRAAERLAKIEVLEELDKLITSTGSKVATMQKISAMLSDLKAAK
jgi:hypothetical protein